MKKLLRVKFNMLVLCVVVAVMALSACRGASGGSDEDYSRAPETEQKGTGEGNQTPAKPNPLPTKDDNPPPTPVAAFVKVEGQGKVATFWMSNHEVTQAEWAKIAGYENIVKEYDKVYSLNIAPSSFKDNPAEGETQEERPVETVTWYDAVYYCIMRTRAENDGKKGECVYDIQNVTVTDRHITNATVTLVEGWQQKKGYRLPTADEWVLAAGNLPTENVGDYAWYKANADSKTHEVMKEKLPSKDLYNMFGNVMEWVWNEQGIIILPSGSELNSEKDYRCYRGGAFNLPDRMLDPQKQQGRGWAMPPSFKASSLGFRICSSFEPKTK